MEPATEAERRAAVADLVGALCYGLLRSLHATASAIPWAPHPVLAERQASFAVEEYTRHRVLRDRLDQLTEEPESAMASFRGPIDAFYDAARPSDWLEAQVFQFVGGTITTDFAEILATQVEAETADALRRALTGRTAQGSLALSEIGGALQREPDGRERVKRFASTMVGVGLNRLREALLDSRRLALVFGGQDGVKASVLELLGRHRERLERLGIESVD